MKVSVIIPFFRGISFLEDCLDSLAEQNVSRYGSHSCM